jgi:hypothetical protein
MNLLDLVRLAQKALETARNQALLQFNQDEVSIDEMICWIDPAWLPLTTALPCPSHQPRREQLAQRISSRPSGN